MFHMKKIKKILQIRQFLMFDPHMAKIDKGL